MILAPLLALLNAARGSGNLPRWLFFPLCGLAAYLGSGSPFVGLAVAGGVALWLAAGWHFDCIHGEYTLESPAKVRWINAVCLKLLPAGERPGWQPVRNKLRGTLWMSLRGLHLYPMFAVLALHEPYALLWGLGVLLQGPIYWLGGRLSAAKPVRVAEALMGLLIGSLVAACW